MGMKAKMRTLYEFNSVDGQYKWHGDCPKWAQGVRDAWRTEIQEGYLVETQTRVRWLTDRKVGAVGRG